MSTCSSNACFSSSEASAEGASSGEASGEKKVDGVATLGIEVSKGLGRLVEASGGLLEAGGFVLVAATVVGMVVVVEASVVVVAGSVGSTHVEVCGIGGAVGAGWLVVVIVSTVVAGGSVVEVDDASGRDEVVEGGTVEVTATVEELEVVVATPAPYDHCQPSAG